MMDKYELKQIELVEFGERVYHSGLRNRGINGNLYEDILIKYLREDIPELTFFKGQLLKEDNTSSNQFDILICKKDTPQLDFLKEISNNINVIKPNDCLAVIELKKYGNPEMISLDGEINSECKKIKELFPNLEYIFVCFRFKDRKTIIEKNWENLKNNLNTDEKFCFWGNVFKEDKEWNFPWSDNEKLIERNKKYIGEYERLVIHIKNLV